MIVSQIHERGASTLAGVDIGWRCLSRRGMLHAECEAFDHLRLGPHAQLALPGLAGSESAWFVVAGEGLLAPLDDTASPQILMPAQLVLLRDTAGVRVRAGGSGLELLFLTVMTGELARVLPARRPLV